MSMFTLVIVMMFSWVKCIKSNFWFKMCSSRYVIEIHFYKACQTNKNIDV